MSIFISVIIATHNGASTLPVVLEGYKRQTRDAADWELIVVDNGSTDGTAAIVEAFSGCLPLTLRRHDIPGKNRALNSGLSIARGNLLVFSDDDAIPFPDWLDRIARIANDQKDYDIFGGRIVPKWPSPPPVWLEGIDLGAVYVVTPHDVATGPAKNGANIWGPNMAVRRRIFDEGARFDEQVGPSADNPKYRMGSETEFIERICTSGSLCWYSNEWQVEHIIHPAQFERKWILGRAFRSGRGTYRPGDVAPALVGNTPRWMLREFLITLFKKWREVALGRTGEKFRTDYRLQFLKGLMQEARSSIKEKSQNKGRSQ